MENSTTQRPTFLTVLCILTWIGCGLGLIGNLMSMAGASLFGSLGGKFMTYYGIQTICVILCLIGSIQMWKMKKTGFYIYTAGELLPLALSYILFADLIKATATLGGKGVASAMAAGGIIGALIPIAFVVMYFVNTKDMK
jgi:hypothetical protein